MTVGGYFLSSHGCRHCGAPTNPNWSEELGMVQADPPAR